MVRATGNHTSGAWDVRLLSLSLQATGTMYMLPHIRVEYWSFFGHNCQIAQLIRTDLYQTKMKNWYKLPMNKLSRPKLVRLLILICQNMGNISFISALNRRQLNQTAKNSSDNFCLKKKQNKLFKQVNMNHIIVKGENTQSRLSNHF